MNNQISIDIPSNLTFVEAREQLLKTFKLGMVYFLQNSPFNNQLEVTFLNEKYDLEESLDKWKNWVFEVSGSFNFENEKSIKEEEYNLGLEVDRVTEMWRIRSDFGISRSVKFFSGDNQNYNSERQSTSFSGSVVKKSFQSFFNGDFRILP